MQKVAILVFADPDTPEGRGRMAHVLNTAKGLKEIDADVKIIFDGIGVKWAEFFNKKEHPFTHHYSSLYEELKDKIAGVCNFCSKGRFEVEDSVKAEGLSFLGDEGKHHNLNDLIVGGYQIITF